MKFCSSIIAAVVLSTLAPVHAFAQGPSVGYVFGAANAAIDNCACSASVLARLGVVFR